MTPRLAAAAMFLAYGVALGGWSGALAAIVARVGLGPAAYGVALTLYTAAYIASMSGAGALARRFTAQRTLVASTVAAAPVLAALLQVGDVVGYFALQIGFGFLAGAVDLTMNAVGARIERGLGRPIFAGLHGAFSVGMAISAAAAGLIAASAAPWVSSLAVVVALWGAVAIVARAVPAERGEPVGAVAVDRRAFASRTLAVLGLVVGASMACENAAMAWSGLVLSREAPNLAALAGFGVSFFAACQAAQRFTVDRWRARVADRWVIVVSLAIAAFGFFVVAAGLGFAPSVVGFAVIGVGTGAVVPCGFALAASQRGFPAATNLSATAFFGAFVRLPAPLIAGAVAGALSLSAVFALFGLMLAAALAATLRFVGPKAAA